KLYDMRIRGNIYMTDLLDAVTSFTHNISIQMISEFELNFEIENLNKLNEDIIILIKRKDVRTSAITQAGTFEEIFKHVTVLNICPEFNTVPDKSISD